MNPPARDAAAPSPPNFAYIACSPHGHVGTSTTARLLSDYFLATRRDFAGFDADPHEPSYAPRFGERVKNVDTAQVQGQIALIDGLLVPDGKPKVVDLWSRAYDRFFQLIKEIGFVEEAREKKVEPVFLFHVDDSHASAAAAYRLGALFPDVETLLIYNAGVAPFGEAEKERLAAFPPHRRIRIGALDPPLRRALDADDLSISYFLIDPPRDMSLVVRSGLKAWLAPIFSQFRSLELRHSLDSAAFLS